MFSPCRSVSLSEFLSLRIAIHALLSAKSLGLINFIEPQEKIEPTAGGLPSVRSTSRFRDAIR